MKKILSLILVAIMLVTAMPMAFAEGNTYKVGDIIQFGSYPQSEVKDETLIAELNALAPEWEDWTSYGYYSGNREFGSMVQGDWMRYVDIKHDGERYRGVKFTQYRPYSTYYNSSSSYTYQDDNGYSTNTVYWFKFESLDWQVLDSKTGFVICETIIDAQPFSNTIYYNSNGGVLFSFFNDASEKNFASDYESSSIREWLNDDFYNTAFADSEKKEIKTTTLNNDGYFTSNGITGYEKLDSNETKDKIFLLSYTEAKNADYGYDANSSAYDTARCAKGSDYAQCQGLEVYKSLNYDQNNNTGWILRSPNIYSHECSYVSYYGNAGLSTPVFYTDSGIRPALKLNDITKVHKHSYQLQGTTQPTCTTQGYTTYACECGDIYMADYVDANDHNYTSEVTKPATHIEDGIETYTCHCGDTFINYIPSIPGCKYTPIIIEPTCTSKGYTTYICECGNSYVSDYKDIIAHTYIAVVTNPTCTNYGYTTYTCECGDTYDSDYVNTVNHKDDNGDYKCDYNCGYEFEKPAPEKELNFFQKIIQWFKNLFAKLFGRNK